MSVINTEISHISSSFPSCFGLNVEHKAPRNRLPSSSGRVGGGGGCRGVDGFGQQERGGKSSYRGHGGADQMGKRKELKGSCEETQKMEFSERRRRRPRL